MQGIRKAAAPNSRPRWPLPLEVRQKTKKVAIVTFVMQQKQYLGLIRPLDSILCLKIMYFADETLAYKDIKKIEKQERLSADEFKKAEKRLASMTSRFNYKKYHDEYRERLADLIVKKSQGKEIEFETRKPRGKVIDLMATRKKSLG